MKLVFGVFIFLFVSFAQGQNLIGGQFVFDSDRNNIAIGGKGIFNLKDEVSFSPSLNYFVRRNEYLAANADLHYALSTGANYQFYGLGGIHFGAFRDLVSSSTFIGFNRRAELNLGINLGVGTQIFTKDNFIFITEAKYIVSGLDRLVLSFGVLFNL